MINVFFKVAALILTVVGYRFAITAPNPPPTKNDKLTETTFFERYIRELGFITHVPPALLLLIQCLVISFQEVQAGDQDQQLISRICPVPSAVNLKTLSTLDITAISLIFIAGLLRRWCFLTLGKLFTYEITIRPNHKLVTSGPYGFVRHPGYTCSILAMAGMVILFVFSPNVYLQACGITKISTAVKCITWGWGIWVAYACKRIAERSDIEDSNLRRVFGNEWEEYARRVPRKFVPGLI